MIWSLRLESVYLADLFKPIRLINNDHMILFRFLKGALSLTVSVCLFVLYNPTLKKCQECSAAALSTSKDKK